MYEWQALLGHGNGSKGWSLFKFVQMHLWIARKHSLITIHSILDRLGYLPGCILCKTHAEDTKVVPQIYVKVEGWCTTEVQRLKEMFIEIHILLHQYAKEYSLGYIHASTLTK